MRAWPCVFAILASAAFSAPARAADGPSATELFNQGRKLLDDKAFDQACELFRASFKLDPRVGTQLNVANCEEQAGHLLSAYQAWLDATALARAAKDDRERFATRRAEALSSRIPKLTVRLAPGTPTHAVLLLDGDKLPPEGAQSIPVAPGEHLLIASEPNFNETRLLLRLDEGQHSDITIDLGKPVATATLDERPAARDAGVIAEKETIPTPRRGSAWMRPTGYALATVGVGAASIGAYFGIEAIAKKSASDAEGQCSGNVCTTGPGLQARRDSAQAASVATASFVVMGVAAAGAVTLFVLAPRPPASASAGYPLYVLAGPLSASVSGNF
jgi:hypothetical protein